MLMCCCWCIIELWKLLCSCYISDVCLLASVWYVSHWTSLLLAVSHPCFVGYCATERHSLRGTYITRRLGPISPHLWSLTNTALRPSSLKMSFLHLRFSPDLNGVSIVVQVEQSVWYVSVCVSVCLCDL